MTALHALNLARKHGITPSALHVLITILDDAPLQPTEAAKRIGISCAAMTGRIDVLVRKGWLVRGESPDRRSVLLQPTEKAFEIFTPTLDEG